MTNILDSLEADLQTKIFTLAEENFMPELQLLELLRTPKPEGMGIQVSRGGLRAFIQRKKRERLLDQTKETLEQAAKFARNGTNDGSMLQEGLIGLLRQRLFEGAAGDMKHAELMALHRMAQQAEWKKEQMEIAREKAQVSREYLKLAKDRFQLSAAKLALDHAEDLRKVIVQGEAQDGEKLQSALAQLFGEKFAKAVKAPKELEEGEETSHNHE